MRRFLWIGSVVLIACALTMVHARLYAQPYPSRPIQLIVPMGAGTATDIHGRIIAEELKRILKTEVIVVNKPGASMTVGTDFVVKSKKDGYTLAYVPTTAITAKAVDPETVPYDAMKDLEPLGLHAFFPVVLSVPANSPWKDMKEFIEEARKNPNKIRISSPGLQTHSSFNMVMVETLTGAHFTIVPYKEGVAAVTNMLGGHVEATSNALSVMIPFAASGQARILMTSKKMPDFPNIPTMRDLGYKQDLPTPWFAMYAPAGISEEIKKILVPAVKEAFLSPEGRDKVNKIGGSVIDYKTPAELKKIAADDLEVISAIAVKLGLRK
jgi:tripartite-type tricarboxylate transporter receptor subunit TctC